MGRFVLSLVTCVCLPGHNISSARGVRLGFRTPVDRTWVAPSLSARRSSTGTASTVEGGLYPASMGVGAPSGSLFPFLLRSRTRFSAPPSYCAAAGAPDPLPCRPQVPDLTPWMFSLGFSVKVIRLVPLIPVWGCVVSSSFSLLSFWSFGPFLLFVNGLFFLCLFFCFCLQLRFGLLLIAFFLDLSCFLAFRTCFLFWLFAAPIWSLSSYCFFFVTSLLFGFSCLLAFLAPIWSDRKSVV